MAYQTTMGNKDEDLFHNAHLDQQERMQNPFVFHAKMMGDIMYLQQALGKLDAKGICASCGQGSQVNGHGDCNNWTLKKRNEVPDNIQIVPSVWSMQHKHILTMNEVKSHKARLNLHGRKQVYGMNYFKTYTPVVTWFAIRFMIIFGIIFGWALPS
jgi:hypothetical protein